MLRFLIKEGKNLRVDLDVTAVGEATVKKKPKGFTEYMPFKY